MNFHILTLFPEMVGNGLDASIIGRAVKQNKIGIETVDIREFTDDRHGRVDDYTYGGGAGMLMQAQPVYDAYQSVKQRIPAESRQRVIYVTPQGTPFTQHMAEELAACDDLVLLCGHYEGIDERVLEEIVTDYVSIGDYVLTGGELAAMVIVDAVARLVPSVLHNEESARTESFCGNLLEYPQYSRPKEWHGREVPQVLLSGNQKKIREWRKQEALERTKQRRPDLYEKYRELEECRKLMLQQKLLHTDMIELINRGRAILVARRDSEIILKDRESHLLFHTWMRDMKKAVDEEKLKRRRENTLLSDCCAHSADMMVLHQMEFVTVMESLGYTLDTECTQAVCTRKEQLPISGLYTADNLQGMENAKHVNGAAAASSGLQIRSLTMEYFDFVMKVYRAADDPEYIRNRIEHGMIFGAFIEGEPAGFIGIHSEGSVGMLEVLPQFRRRKVASALETYVCNLLIAQGMVPYGQIVIGNDASTALQQSLGIYMAKDPIYWMSR